MSARDSRDARDPRAVSWVKRVLRIDRGVKGVERDVDAEFAFHLEMRTRKLVAKGFSTDEARNAAVLQFGDFAGVRDECVTIDRGRERRMQLSDLLGNVRQDARYALRSLVEHRAFSCVVVLTLALGIGANTAIFSVVDALMLRSLPVPHPEQLVAVGDPSNTGLTSHGSERADVFSYPLFKDILEHNDVFSGMYAIGQAGSLDVVVQDNASSGVGAVVPEHPVARFVSGGYFDVLQVHARVGRTFTAAEDNAPNADPYVVLGDGYWQRRFAGDASVVGKKLSINGTTVTVIGVTPPSFTGDIVGGRADFWIPMMMQPALKPNPWLTDRSLSWLLLMGRMAPGKTLAQARQSVRGVAEQALRANMTDSNWTRFAEKLREKPIPVDIGALGFSYVRASFSKALVVLMSAVAVVLLVVCANVANLMLARAASRQREISVRLALGASRARLIEQLLTESVLLSVIAAALGLGFAAWGTRTLLSIATRGPNPIPLDTHLDARMLAYTSAVTLLTAILFGLLPALRATRVDVATALRTQGRGASGALRGTGRGARLPLAKVLVIAQVGLSVLLLVGTGVLLRSMQRVAQADLGLARDQLLMVTVDAQHRGYKGARLDALIDDITARTARLPGVVAVSYSGNGIFSGTETNWSVRIPGYEIRADSDKVVTADLVGPGYFHAIGASLLRGREIQASDGQHAARVAVINQTMAKYYFKDADAVGRTLIRNDSAYTIVGVVRDAEEQSVGAAPVRRAYFSMHQLAELPGVVYFDVRTKSDPAELVKPAQAALLAIDPMLPVSASPLNTLVQADVSQSILMTQVISFFGALTLLLAALGLYGVIAFTTARRTSEFGLRMALGASGREVTGMVLREALALCVIGLVVGLPAGVGAVRLIRSQLFQVGAFDPMSSALAAALLVVVAVAAAGIPALRASRVAPMEALRGE